MDKKIVILGAGIAGISAAHHANEQGYKATVYEASSKPGGLVSNFSINEFRFDHAIHMSFTKNDYVRSIFDLTPYNTHKPNAYCKDREYWLKHPVQNNLFPLPLEEKIAYIESFLERPTSKPDNYKQWLICQYGQEISRNYPELYTRKYWGLNPEELSLSWIGDRVRKADLKEVLSGALEPRQENHFYASEMRYPKQGGYFSFIENITRHINIQCNKKVTKINVDDKVISFSDNSTAEYQNLVSSLPIPVICNLIEKCPESVLNAANTLRWTTVDLISVGFNKPDAPPYLWFYIYDDDCLAARGYSPSMKSADNAPPGKSSLQFEIYNLSTNKRLDENDLIKNIKSKLLEMNICEESDIEFMHHKHLPFGNVIFDHGMEDRRDIVLSYLKSIDISSCGRFGEWDYLWSDQSFLSGKNAINHFCTDI